MIAWPGKSSGMTPIVDVVFPVCGPATSPRLFSRLIQTGVPSRAASPTRMAMSAV